MAILTITVTWDWPDHPEFNSVDVHMTPFDRLGGIARQLAEHLAGLPRDESCASIEYPWATMRVILKREEVI